MPTPSASKKGPPPGRSALARDHRRTVFAYYGCRGRGGGFQPARRDFAVHGWCMAIVNKQAEIDATSPQVGGRADRLVQELTGLSRSQVTGLFDHDCVQINSAEAHEPGQPLALGDIVALRYDNARRY